MAPLAAQSLFGNDRTALCRRRGNMVTRKVLTWRNKDNMQVAGVIGRMFDELDSFEQPSTIVVDVIGHRQVFCTFAPKVPISHPEAQRITKKSDAAYSARILPIALPTERVVVTQTFCVPSLRYLPRIDEGYSRRLEISDVASDQRHAMHKGSGRDECVALAALVGYTQPGAA